MGTSKETMFFSLIDELNELFNEWNKEHKIESDLVKEHNKSLIELQNKYKTKCNTLSTQIYQLSKELNFDMESMDINDKFKLYINNNDNIQLQKEIKSQIKQLQSKLFDNTKQIQMTDDEGNSLKIGSDTNILLSAIPIKGILRIEDDWGYLEINNSVRDEIRKALNLNNFTVPPYDAHVSVFTEEEIKNTPELIHDKNKEFVFYFGNIETCVPEDWNEVNEVLMVTGTSRELEDLRIKHGLEPLMYGKHEFHITLGIDKKDAKIAAKLNNDIQIGNLTIIDDKNLGLTIQTDDKQSMWFNKMGEDKLFSWLKNKKKNEIQLIDTSVNDVAGILFDFLGFLTSVKNEFTNGSEENCVNAIAALQQFLKREDKNIEFAFELIEPNLEWYKKMKIASVEKTLTITVAEEGYWIIQKILDELEIMSEIKTPKIASANHYKNVCPECGGKSKCKCKNCEQIETNDICYYCNQDQPLRKQPDYGESGINSRLEKLRMGKMTLNEAIIHAEENAKGDSSCALEHRQLVEWLKECRNNKIANTIYIKERFANTKPFSVICNKLTNNTEVQFIAEFPFTNKYYIYKMEWNNFLSSNLSKHTSESGCIDFKDKFNKLSLTKRKQYYATIKRKSPESKPKNIIDEKIFEKTKKIFQIKKNDFTLTTKYVEKLTAGFNLFNTPKDILKQIKEITENCDYINTTSCKENHSKSCYEKEEENNEIIKKMINLNSFKNIANNLK